MKKSVLIVLVLLCIVLLILWLLFRKPELIQTRLSTASGMATTEFQFFDSLVLDASDLEPATGYQVRIVDDQGLTMIENRLSTDREGRIADAIVWYAIGVRPCGESPVLDTEPTPYSRLVDTSRSAQTYTLQLSLNGSLIREVPFEITPMLTRPVLYAADASGCPKSGFLVGEETVWVVGRNFPENSLIRVWVVPAATDWVEGDTLADQTTQFGYEQPPLFELKAGETHFAKQLWPGHLTASGSYDIVAEVVTHPFGVYKASETVPASDVISSHTYSGFVVQRRPSVAEPLEMDIAGAVASPFVFRSSFLTSDHIYVGVDPTIQPSFVGQTAKVYIVQDKTEAQWNSDPSLNDVTGFVEQLTVNGICGNCWKTLAWAPPLAVGKYDVVLDFNLDGQYTPGTDLIDSLNPVGFTVSEIRVDSVSFNYSGSGAITLYDDQKATVINAPEYVAAGQTVKPAAWIAGGTHNVKATFSAASSVSQAKIWAETGLGGLASSASPILVSFSGGTGTATFTANTPPSSINKTTFSWNWRYKDVNGSPSSPVDTGETRGHLLYTVLANPTAPQAQPWVGTLDVACSVATGKTTAAEATREIWADFYYNAGGLYDTTSGAARYTGPWSQDFNLTKWLNNYATSNIGVVNCYDMGKAVVVFANALGCGAEYTYTNPFGYLNAVRPIGRGWTNNPFYEATICGGSSPPSYCNQPIVAEDSSYPQRTSFGNHGFSRVAGQIFDGSGGRVDIDGNPDAAPHTPHELDGDDSWSSLYKTRVIDDNPISSPGTPTAYSFGVY